MSMRLHIFIILFIVCTLSAYGLNVHVAPMLYIDETAGTVRDNGRVHHELLQNLHAEMTGIALNFSLVSDGSVSPPQSLADVMTVCRMNRSEYLLYGFVVERDYSVEAEIRLFDYEKRSVIGTFYGKDDHEHYDRMMEDVSQKILSYVNDAFDLELFEERPEYLRLFVPVELGYWTPMGDDWLRLMLGTGVFSTGISVIPTDSLYVYQGKNFYLSTGLNVTYRLGAGNPRAYKAFYHSIMMELPVRLHMDLTKHHGIFAGTAFIYFADILSVTQKYEDPVTEVYSNFGFELMAGYLFTLNDRVSFYFNNSFNFAFSETNMFTYSPRIGINISVYKKELTK